MDGRKLSSEEQYFIRERAVRMVCEEGFTKLEASRALGVTRQAIGRAVALYEEGTTRTVRASVGSSPQILELISR